MLVLTHHHFQFADLLTRKTPVFRQSLVIHACMHLRREIATFKNSAPPVIWTRILAGVNQGFLSEVHHRLLWEMVHHSAQLIAHDHPNLLIGVAKGAHAMIVSERSVDLLIEQKNVRITEEGVQAWIFLLTREGMEADYAAFIVRKWVALHLYLL